MKVAFSLELELELFQLEEAKQAEQLATKSNSQIYSYKTSGNQNWLERGFSMTDVLGIVVLPQGLPDTIDLPDDAEDED